jgi:hypothetical protein
MNGRSGWRRSNGVGDNLTPDYGAVHLLQSCNPVGNTDDEEDAAKNTDQIREPPKHALEHQILSLAFCSTGGSFCGTGLNIEAGGTCQPALFLTGS